MGAPPHPTLPAGSRGTSAAPGGRGEHADDANRRQGSKDAKGGCCKSANPPKRPKSHLTCWGFEPCWPLSTLTEYLFGRPEFLQGMKLEQRLARRRTLGRRVAPSRVAGFASSLQGGQAVGKTETWRRAPPGKMKTVHRRKNFPAAYGEQEQPAELFAGRSLDESGRHPVCAKMFVGSIGGGARVGVTVGGFASRCLV